MIKTDVIERLHKLAEKATEEDAKELNAIANDVTMCMFSIDQFTVRLSSMIETPEPKEEEKIKNLGPLVSDCLSARALNQVKALTDMDESYFNDLRISKEKMRQLKKLNLYTELRIGHFDGLPIYAFAWLRNCGKKTVHEIECLMNENGFHLSNRITI